MEHDHPPHPVAVAVAVAQAPAWRSRIPWRALSFVPLALLLLALAASALGGSGSTNANAATTDEGDIVVTGIVAPVITLDASGCAAGAIDLGTLVPGDPFATTTSDCAIDFGTTNHGAGVDLVVNEDPGAPAAGHAMKCVAATCAGDALDDYQGATAPPAGTSAFGMVLRGVSGGAAGVWPADPAVNEVPDVAVTACQTSGIGTGTCTFRYGASADVATDGPGAYQAQVEFTALAR